MFKQFCFHNKKYNQILGTWELVEWRHILKNDQVRYPFGKDAVGLLAYTREGFMTGALMRRDRKFFENPRLRAGQESEKIAAYDGYVHYGGRFRVEGNEVIHQVQISLFPNWVGTEQRRFFVVHHNTLILSASELEVPSSSVAKVEVEWKRVC